MQRLIHDLRAIGWWAPLRLFHEIDRRLGLAGRFLRMTSGRAGAAQVASPFAVPLSASDSIDVETAGEIAEGSVRIFDRTLDLGAVPNWYASDVGEPWPRAPWWRIDLRPGDGRDVKHVFELGRHAHLVTLAKAALATGEPKYVETLERHFESWFEQCPPEIGIHWYSNLEIALRALAWLQIVHMVGDRLSDITRRRMADHLFHSGRHIVWGLPYTLSSMRNNHLIGDAVGLAAIGRAFPDSRKARRWARLGDRLLEWHVPDHVHADGSTLEDSTGYRAFVLELLQTRLAMGDGPPSVASAADRLGRHLARLGAGAGPVPHIGDWDGGRVPGGSRDGPLEEPPDAGDAGAEAAVEADGNDAGGGIGRIERGQWTVWLKAGSGESHGHADLLSAAIRKAGHWVVGDPGNGSYNRTMAERDYFRSTVAHSALELEGEDQRVPHRRFRWRYSPSGSIGEPFDVGGYRVMWGSHDAYERLDPPRTVLRACAVGPDAVVVTDWIVGGPAKWRLSIPLHPEVTVAGDLGGTSPGGRVAVTAPDGTRLDLLVPGRVTASLGSTVPYDGWWADGYDDVRPSPRLEVTGHGSGPVVWALLAPGAPRPGVDGGTLVVAGRGVGVTENPEDGRPSLGPR